jgi:hypothetical protein
MILLARSEYGYNTKELMGLGIAEATTIESAREFLSVLAAFREQGYSELLFPDGTLSVGVAIGVPPFAGLAVSSPSGQHGGKYLARQAIETVGRIHEAMGLHTILPGVDEARVDFVFEGVSE